MMSNALAHLRPRAVPQREMHCGARILVQPGSHTGPIDSGLGIAATALEHHQPHVRRPNGFAYLWKPVTKTRCDPALHRLDRVAYVISNDLPVFTAEVIEQWRSYEPAEGPSHATPRFIHTFAGWERKSETPEMQQAVPHKTRLDKGTRFKLCTRPR